MSVVPIACLADNYAYVVYSDASLRGNGAQPTQAVVVDPSEAGPVVDYLEKYHIRLGGLLLTHHHWDHVGGVAGLRERFGDVPVLAHRLDGVQVRGVTRHVTDGERVTLAELEFEAIHVPGHTLGAIAYRCRDALFTGDTLFIAGCGRLFEGTAADMFSSLMKLAALPEHTQIYCGHEYALRNLAFARSVEPGNAHVVDRIESIGRLRKEMRPSVPATLRQELDTNPFLRCANPEFRERVDLDPSLDSLEVFIQMRSRRDGFQG